MEDKQHNGKLVRYQCDIPEATKRAIEHVFAQQGLIAKEGTTRLFDWIAAADPRIWPIVFRQDAGTEQELLRLMLRKPRAGK